MSENETTELEMWERDLWRLLRKMQEAHEGVPSKLENLVRYAWEEARQTLSDRELAARFADDAWEPVGGKREHG